MQRKYKVMLVGAVGVFAALLALHATMHKNPQLTQVQQTGGTESQAQQTDAAEALVSLVTEQFEQQPQAEGGAEVLCAPLPPNIGDLAPITHFTCGATFPNDSQRFYTVTIPAGWQEGQEPFTSMNPTNPNN